MDGSLVGVPLRNRRIDSRYLCADLVRVDWIAGEDDTRSIEGVIDDISHSGASLELEEPLPSGASVVIWLHDAFFAGLVRYCVFRDYTYLAGVEFSSSTPWTAGAVQPEHLTNLNALVADGNPSGAISRRTGQYP